MVLIETYWNVNASNTFTLSDTTKVLIETYWNVNRFFKQVSKKGTCVLIETYWNVNLPFPFPPLPFPSY